VARRGSLRDDHGSLAVDAELTYIRDKRTTRVAMSQPSGFEAPPGLDNSEIDLRDYLPSIASGQIGVWHRAVAMQAERILHPQASQVEQQTDAYLFVQALRQVLRGTDLMLRGLGDDPRAQIVERAIAEFNDSIPHAKDARDVLDHFDDYARGIGRLSHPEARNPREREARSSAEAAAQFTIFYEKGSGGNYALHIGDLVIDIAQARDAASVLADSVLAAWWEPADDAIVKELVGEIEANDPRLTVYSFLLVAAGELPAETLESLVTPESLPLWDLEAVRLTTRGYGLASRVIYSADDVAYMKLVNGPQFMAVISEPTIVQALIITLVRRPDIKNEWRIHAIGRSIPPDDLPRTLN
jgi:hypothetical protein